MGICCIRNKVKEGGGGQAAGWSIFEYYSIPVAFPFNFPNAHSPHYVHSIDRHANVSSDCLAPSLTVTTSG